MIPERLHRRVAGGAAALGTVWAIGAAPTGDRRHHIDHRSYENVVERIRRGQGPYDAIVDGLRDIDIHISQVRTFRQVPLFLLWAAIPEPLLQASFFVLVVLGSMVLAIHLLRWPVVALAVGLWLARAGVYAGVDAWLLFELWTTPLVLGAALAWLRRRDWLAAALVFAAMLIRETVLPLPIGLLLAARAQRRSPWPWLGCIGASGAALLVHWALAAPHVGSTGNEAPLIGTGSADAVVRMTHFIVMPAALGVVLWSVGVVLIWRSALRGFVGLALVPVVGLAVDRPYWGWLGMPLCVLALGGLERWPSGAASPTSPGPRGPAATTAPGAAPATSP